MQEMLSSEVWSIAQTDQGSVVLLRPKDMDVMMPVFTSKFEVQSILIGKEGVTLPRPLTHDLFLNMLSRLNLTLHRVEIYEVRDNTLYARLVIVGGEFTREKPLVLDARPSDAIALAVRRRYPVLISAALIKRAGLPLDFFDDSTDEAGDENADLFEAEEMEEDKRQVLRDQLDAAIAVEKYERAAEIRDLLKLMEKEKNSD